MASEESITFGEDKENLLYISKKINIDEFGLGEEGLWRESATSLGSKLSVDVCGSDVELLEEITMGRSCSNPELLGKLRPFILSWSFGVNSKVGVINLTTNSRKELFYSSCHSAVLYNYCTKSMKHLEGHKNIISSISSSKDGRWLVSADADIEGYVIVWDSIAVKPVLSLYNIYEKFGVLQVAISSCAKYLITIGEDEDEYIIDFWLWTLGEEQPHDTYKVEKVHGDPLRIAFNPDQPEHIMIVFEKQIFFLVWDPAKNKFAEKTMPQMTSKRKIGRLTCGTYVNQCHECYVSTNRGWILVFRNTLYTRDYEDGELNNAKMFINAVKVTPANIGVITTTDGILVVGDSKGHIYFFDKRIRILYWLRNFSLGPITGISFSLTPKDYKYQNSKILVNPKALYEDYTVVDCANYHEVEGEIEKIIAMNVPFDATLENQPFMVRDFFVSTTDCNIYSIDFLHNVSTPLFHDADANISAIDAHDEKPYIVLGFENGRVTLLNFEKKAKTSTCILPTTEETRDLGDTISYIKYSYESLHLVCGRNNGELWIMEPMLLTPKQTFKCSYYQILKIEFALNSLQCAYYDSNKTVFLFQYHPDESSWNFVGKLRPHYEPINDMMFFPLNEYPKSVLYTIGADRHLVGYNNLRINFEAFSIASRERIEQTAIPMNFVYYIKRTANNKLIGYFLVADDKHKLKFIHETTKVPRALLLGPAFGCFEESHIKKMKILPEHNFRYLVFRCKKHLGLQILPPDGNPYKYTGYLAHPKELRDFVVSYDGKYVFTFGINDRNILQWEIKPSSVEILHVMGGTELEPYYCLIEGGKNGWLFHEIQDLFFYMQILQQENIDLPRRVSDTINLTEIPDLVRTCGYYPSDFELETMMIDIRYRDLDESGIARDEITFIEFVKLFLNHRPSYGYSRDQMRKNFDVICEMADYPKRAKIESPELVYLLHTQGEPSTNLHKHLTNLLRVYTFGENNWDFLPQDITFEWLINELLGIDMEKHMEEEFSDDEEHVL